MYSCQWNGKFQAYLGLISDQVLFQAIKLFHIPVVKGYMGMTIVEWLYVKWILSLVIHPAIHHSDIIMSVMASQITSLAIVYLTIYSGAHQRTHQSSVSLAFVSGIHRWRVNSPHKGPLKLFARMHNHKLCVEYVNVSDSLINIIYWLWSEIAVCSGLKCNWNGCREFSLKYDISAIDS